MAFEPQNDLERSLVQAARDPACRPQFYRDFMSADLFVIQEGEPPATSGRRTLEAGYQLKVRPVEVRGKSYLPVFSSLPRLQAVLREQAGYIALNATDLLKSTQGADLILNPGSDFGKEFTAAEIASMLDGSLWQPTERYVATKPIKVLLGRPARYPTELVEALTRLFKKRKEVKRAWLAHYFNPEQGDKPHTLIALEVSGNGDQISAETGLVAKESLVPDPPVDIMLLSGRGGVEDYFVKTDPPFYERKRFGLF